MARVQMLVQVSGTRDGADWPAPGEVIDLPDEEAASLVFTGIAAELDADVEPKAAKRGPKIEKATARTSGLTTADL